MPRPGYRIPEASIDMVETYAPPSSRPPAPISPKRRKPAQVQVMFPVEAGLEFRFVFDDGKESAWRDAGKGIIQAPPAARKIEWRWRQIPEKEN